MYMTFGMLRNYKHTERPYEILFVNWEIRIWRRRAPL